MHYTVIVLHVMPYSTISTTFLKPFHFEANTLHCVQNTSHMIPTSHVDLSVVSRNLALYICCMFFFTNVHVMARQKYTMKVK